MASAHRSPSPCLFDNRLTSTIVTCTALFSAVLARPKDPDLTDPHKATQSHILCGAAVGVCLDQILRGLGPGATNPETKRTEAKNDGFWIGSIGPTVEA